MPIFKKRTTLLQIIKNRFICPSFETPGLIALERQITVKLQLQVRQC